MNSKIKVALFLLLIMLLILPNSALAEETVENEGTIIISIAESPLILDQEKGVEIGQIYSKEELKSLKILINNKELDETSYTITPKEIQAEGEINSKYEFQYSLYITDENYAKGEYLLFLQIEDLEGQVKELEQSIEVKNPEEKTSESLDNATSEKETSQSLDSITSKEKTMDFSSNTVSEETKSSTSTIPKVQTYSIESFNNNGQPTGKLEKFTVSEGGYVGTEYKLTAQGESPNRAKYEFYYEDLDRGGWKKSKDIVKIIQLHGNQKKQESID